MLSTNHWHHDLRIFSFCWKNLWKFTPPKCAFIFITYIVLFFFLHILLSFFDIYFSLFFCSSVLYFPFGTIMHFEKSAEIWHQNKLKVLFTKLLSTFWNIIYECTISIHRLYFIHRSSSMASMNGAAGWNALLMRACDSPLVLLTPTKLEYYGSWGWGGHGWRKISPNRRGISTRDTFYWLQVISLVLILADLRL